MRTLTVSGLGAVEVAPDRAVLRLTAEHRAAGIAEALAGASSAADGIVAVARRFTDPDRIASGGLQVWPGHDHQGRPDGFDARHVLIVTCPDLDLAGALVTAAVAEVGERVRVESVGLEVGEPGDAVARARVIAFGDARARAEHLAALAGGVLGEVQSVAEGGGSPAEGGGFAEAAMAATRDVSFQPGLTRITQVLTVVWQLV